jgi:hypothetical protein
MALLWFDGFDHYGTDTARLTEGPYDQVDAAFTLSEVNPRTGTRCLRRASSGSDAALIRELGGPRPVVGAGAVLSLDNLPNSENNYNFIVFYVSVQNSQITATLNPDGSI